MKRVVILAEWVVSLNVVATPASVTSREVSGPEPARGIGRREIDVGAGEVSCSSNEVVGPVIFGFVSQQRFEIPKTATWRVFPTFLALFSFSTERTPMALLVPGLSPSSSCCPLLRGELPLACFSPKPNLLKLRRSPSGVKASWQELAGVLIFSAIPFTAVKAVANSSLGERLRQRMEETKKVAVESSARFKSLAKKAREESFWYGKGRPRWLGPIPYDYPSYLTGELPGDYGFDIAGLGKDPVAFQKYFNFEILHARWAMLASLGVIVPELLDQFGVVHFIEPVWWKVGYAKLQGDTLDYLGIPGFHIAGSQGVIVIAICQALLMVGPEYARYCGIEALEPLGIYLPGDINYPGGLLFDPLGLSNDPVAFEELKVKEIKNGRLAMIAWIGFYLQAALTGKGPVQNLVEHISDPLHNNVLSFIKSV